VDEAGVLDDPLELDEDAVPLEDEADEPASLPLGTADPVL
jgi:hypothetical protein